MKMFYITLNSAEEATQLSIAMLSAQLAVCTNWFAIDCAYLLDGIIHTGKEFVLIVKTQDNMRGKIEALIAEHIAYNNYIAELDVTSINPFFSNWLQKELK